VQGIRIAVHFKVNQFGVDLANRWRAAVLKRGDDSSSYEFEQRFKLDQAVTRLAFLSEASRRLSFALSDQECFQQLLDLLVPDLADLAIFNLVTEEKEIKRIASAHRDPKKAVELKSIENKYPPSIKDLVGAGCVIRTGESEFVQNFDSKQAELLLNHRYPELGDMIRDMKVRSKICVPVKAMGETYGALALFNSDERSIFTPDDLILAEEVASRAGLAVYHLFRYQKATEKLERLKVEIDVREAYISQVRHDVLNTITSALMMTQVMEHKIPSLKEPVQKVTTALWKVADGLKKLKK
jgi:GAF domain-containing protein